MHKLSWTPDEQKANEVIMLYNESFTEDFKATRRGTKIYNLTRRGCSKLLIQNKVAQSSHLILNDHLCSSLAHLKNLSLMKQSTSQRKVVEFCPYTQSGRIKFYFCWTSAVHLFEIEKLIKNWKFLSSAPDLNLNWEKELHSRILLKNKRKISNFKKLLNV